MTQHQDDFEEFLRRALHAAADPVEPSGDGLEQIRARLTAPHSLPVALLLAACSGVSRRAVGGLDYLSARLRVVGGASSGRWRAWFGTPGCWRVVPGRLAAALVMTAFVVAAVAFAGGPVLRAASSLTGTLISSMGGGGPGGSGGPGVDGQGNPLPAGGGTSSVSASAGAATGTAPSAGNPGQPGSGECATQAPVLGTPAGSPPASVNPAVSRTPDASSSPAASTTPTPDPSSSPAVGTTPNPDPSGSPGGNASPSATATPCPTPAAAVSPASPSADTTFSSAGTSTSSADPGTSSSLDTNSSPATGPGRAGASPP